MNTYICEFCNCQHDGSYGSGRFCSKSCRMAYIASKVKSHKCNWNSNKNHKPFGTWKCPHCDFIGETRAKLKEHQHKEHPHFCVEGGWNKGLTKETNSIVKQYGEHSSKSLKEGYSFGRIKRIPHSEKFKKEQSIRAKKQKLGGWCSSKRIEYNGISMQSTYEVTVAKTLDENQIKWKRPEPFQYEMNGEQHRYYPDFYLPEYNVYLDPKNDFLINNPNPRYGIKDSDKIHLVEKQNNVRILILDKNHLNWKHIHDLIVNKV